jgi:hypothetical protein
VICGVKVAKLDQVPAHYEVLEASHGITFPADANEPCADAGAASADRHAGFSRAFYQ